MSTNFVLSTLGHCQWWREREREAGNLLNGNKCACKARRWYAEVTLYYIYISVTLMCTVIHLFRFFIVFGHCSVCVRVCVCARVRNRFCSSNVIALLKSNYRLFFSIFCCCVVVSNSPCIFFNLICSPTAFSTIFTSLLYRHQFSWEFDVCIFNWMTECRMHIFIHLILSICSLLLFRWITAPLTECSSIVYGAQFPQFNCVQEVNALHDWSWNCNNCSVRCQQWINQEGRNRRIRTMRC